MKRSFFTSLPLLATGAASLLVLATSIRAADATPTAASNSRPPNTVEHHTFLYSGEWDTRKPLQSIFLVKADKIVWSHAIPLRPEPKKIQEFDDITMLPNGNIVYSCMSGAGMIAPDKTMVWKYDAPPGTEIHSAQPLDHDRVLIMRNGNPAYAMIVRVPSGELEKQIEIPTTTTGTHGQFRHIRMTPAGTLLVPHLSEKKVVEYDLEGHVLWQVEAPSPWHAVRLKNGNTLIAGDWSAYVREVNSKGETVWELTQADVPGIKLFNTQTANRLANGNTLICNWCGGSKNQEEWPNTVQVFEVTPEKKVVWTLSSWKEPDLGTSTCIQLLTDDGRPDSSDMQR